MTGRVNNVSMAFDLKHVQKQTEPTYHRIKVAIPLEHQKATD